MCMKDRGQEKVGRSKTSTLDADYVQLQSSIAHVMLKCAFLEWLAYLKPCFRSHAQDILHIYSSSSSSASLTTLKKRSS